MTTLKVGIATLEQYKQRTMAIARGSTSLLPASRRSGSSRLKPVV
jgi:predicted transcriptional regulator